LLQERSEGLNQKLERVEALRRMKEEELNGFAPFIKHVKKFEE
jgi:hypothetical protein